MKFNLRNNVLLLVVLAAAFSRLIPHAPNVTPIGALALFGAAYFNRKYVSLLVPVLAIFLSSLVINNVMYQSAGFVWFDINFPAQIIAFTLVALVGMRWLKTIKFSNVLGSSISASLIFFIISNFSTWLSDGMYPMTFEGLVLCYEMAIPFFWNTLLGDMMYVAILFGGFELAKKQFPVLSLNPISSK